MKLVEFTAPNGKIVHVNPDLVEDVQKADNAHWNAKTVIFLANGYQAVLEPEEEVLNKLK